ncbi:4'-phosphopantetheinyl transferase superfamily protein [Niabella pedocola]|uniref:Enterobactin synthase component D n=1 Tax=Niabella pedocola TaxID=1752077 RepID=A0ABS8PND3_9BACT|nr:4'-phosphopantetheinyl transferase superfamily protein [Niabella pedocola]MCD2421281.1 4'-phosphopantetheinyl transferase superfamily protein [Niabella pedocola]
MPVIFQEEINNAIRLGIWKIEEPPDFFREKVPLHRAVTHPHKMLQHLAGRFLLQYLFPGFPYHLIQIAETRKPFLPDEAFHFSISHCGDYAAAIVSREQRVGIDIEIPVAKVVTIRHKFMSPAEMELLNPLSMEEYTQVWSAKEAVYKWYGLGKVDFREHIRITGYNDLRSAFDCRFMLTNSSLKVHLQQFSGLCLSYVVSE